MQEEPANKGAWPFIALKLPEHLDGLRPVRRDLAAGRSPRTGRRLGRRCTTAEQAAASIEAALSHEPGR